LLLAAAETPPRRAGEGALANFPLATQRSANPTSSAKKFQSTVPAGMAKSTVLVVAAKAKLGLRIACSDPSRRAYLERRDQPPTPNRPMATFVLLATRVGEI